MLTIQRGLAAVIVYTSGSIILTLLRALAYTLRQGRGARTPMIALQPNSTIAGIPSGESEQSTPGLLNASKRYST